MTAEEHLKVIVGDMHAHLVTQLAMAFSERDQARAERDLALKALADVEHRLKNVEEQTGFLMERMSG